MCRGERSEPKKLDVRVEVSAAILACSMVERGEQHLPFGYNALHEENMCQYILLPLLALGVMIESAFGASAHSVCADACGASGAKNLPTWS